MYILKIILKNTYYKKRSGSIRLGKLGPMLGLFWKETDDMLFIPWTKKKKNQHVRASKYRVASTPLIE